MLQTTFSHYLVTASFSDECIPGRIVFTFPLQITGFGVFPSSVTVKRLIEKEVMSRLKSANSPLILAEKTSVRHIMEAAGHEASRIVHLSVGDPEPKNDIACIHCGLE
jgi:hypothetical protein